MANTINYSSMSFEYLYEHFSKLSGKARTDVQTDLNNHQEWYILRRSLCSKDRMLTNLPDV